VHYHFIAISLVGVRVGALPKGDNMHGEAQAACQFDSLA
jgi:hypothetical protein